MKRYAITLASNVVNVVEAAGDSSGYHYGDGGDHVDLVVYKENEEVVRVPREHILYVTISPESTS
jgi:hypothetical protein